MLKKRLNREVILGCILPSGKLIHRSSMYKRKTLRKVPLSQLEMFKLRNIDQSDPEQFMMARDQSIGSSLKSRLCHPTYQTVHNIICNMMGILKPSDPLATQTTELPETHKTFTRSEYKTYENFHLSEFAILMVTIVKI